MFLIYLSICILLPPYSKTSPEAIWRWQQGHAEDTAGKVLVTTLRMAAVV